MSEDCLLLRKDLSRPLRPAQWPEGMNVVTLTPSLLQPVHALLSLGYANGDGSVEPLEHWQHCLNTTRNCALSVCWTVRW